MFHLCHLVLLAVATLLLTSAHWWAIAADVSLEDLVSTRQSIPDLTQLLRTGSPAQKVAAASEIRRRGGGPNGVPALFDHLGHRGQGARDHLSSREEYEAAISLVNALVDLLDDPSPQVRAAAANALSMPFRVAEIQVVELRDAYSRAIRPLATNLEHDDERVRELSAFALMRIGSLAQPAFSSLLRATKDSNRSTRIHAVRALWSVAPDSDRSERTTVMALGDSDPIVRKVAAEYLGYHGSNAVLGALEKARSDPDPRVADAAAKAIERIKAPASRAR